MITWFKRCRLPAHAWRTMAAMGMAILLAVQRGGIRYDLLGLSPGFQTAQLQVQMDDACGTANCIQ